jgi:hypothetical protein
MHPILTIFSTYNRVHTRAMRTLELFVLISYAFVFALLPFNLEGNEEWRKVKFSRKIQDKNLQLENFEIPLYKVTIYFS